MTIASALTSLNTDIVNARTAITNKGGTVTVNGGSSQLATDIATIPSGGSSPVITSLSVTPSTSSQTITAPSGTDGYSPVNVAAVTAAIDSNIRAGNIKSGVSILGVSGSVTELNGETRSVSLTSSSGNTFTPSSGKNGITSITVTPNNQARTVTPSTSSQSLTVNSGYSGNGAITVNAVTSSIDANITAGNIKKDVTILGVTGTYEGGGSATLITKSITQNGTYNASSDNADGYSSVTVNVSGGGSGDVTLTRVSDDNGNEIGTWYMNFEDGNSNIYKVILLDAQYRLASSQWADATGSVTNMPLYSNLKDSNVWQASETATTNTQYILDWCTANSHTSTACTHCRSKSFTISGTTYYGQLPNMIEVIHLAKHYNSFDALDTSASSHSSLNFSSARYIWSSSQSHSSTGWYLNNYGYVNSLNRTANYFACPVLEIPLNS